MKLLALALSCTALLCGGVYTEKASATHKAKLSKLVYTQDWETATRIVGRYYGSRVRNWLWNCSFSEGGHGGFVWYSHTTRPMYGYSSTPGGWVQFMGSTFYSNVGWAFNDARRRGLRAYPKARSYYEPLGQAIVAGAMYYYHGNPGTWTGAYC